MLENLNNYGVFSTLIQNNSLTINTDDISINNWYDYYYGIINVMKDGIETEFIQSVKIDIVFGDTGKHCKFTIMDLYYNIIVWYLIIRAGEKIQPKHIFFDEAITKGTIKKYIDDHFITTENKKKLTFIEMNNYIADMLQYFINADEFSMYLANTINLEDFIEMMNNNQEFNDLMHADLSNVPLEDVKNHGMKLTHRAIDLIKDSKNIIGYHHCLFNSFMAKQGVSDKQFKEFALNVGTKPDGKGGAYPEIINNSYIGGGIDNLLYQFIDSSSSRYAQIITKNKTGESGDFARKIGLNNINSYLHPDPDYYCDTKHFLKINIANEHFLKLFGGRYYKFSPDGMEYLCKGTEKELIGQTLYFRSPTMCASEARGEGVCHRCYGTLAWTNVDVRIGKMAAELLTRKTTQERLSSKHLLETKIKKFNWNDNFNKYMEMSMNAICLNSELEMFDDMYLIIKHEDIKLENESDYDRVDYNDEESSEGNSYNEYVTEFYIQTGNDEANMIKVCGDTEDYKMFISNELENLIKTNSLTKKNIYKLRFSDISYADLFYLNIQNNELGKSLDDLETLINKKDITSSYTIDDLVFNVLKAAIDGDLDFMAVHYEVLIMNQIRSLADDLKKPDWSRTEAPYKILSLYSSLYNHPSITVTLLFQSISKMLRYPLTFRKTGSSITDIFFMERPQTYLKNIDNENYVEQGKPKLKFKQKEDEISSVQICSE